MKAKTINEDITNLLKPKSEKQIEKDLSKIEKEIENIIIREDAIKYVANKLNIDEELIFDDLINYFSDKDFNNALKFILRNNFEVFIEKLS